MKNTKIEENAAVESGRSPALGEVVPLDGIPCAHVQFEEIARRRPDAIAVACGGCHLTYGELERRANKLARRLRKRGAKQETLVGICLDRSVDMMIGLLGVLKAGAAYVPLDPDYPQARLQYMVEEAHIPLVLTQPGYEGIFEGFSTRAVSLDESEGAVGSAGRRLENCSDHDHLAYVIYTSGSTGRPKGTYISHRNLSNFLNAFRRTLDFSPRDRLLAVTTLCFDIAGLELLLPITTGACVDIADKNTASNPFRLSARLLQSQVTCMQATPATWRMLVTSGWERDPTLKVLCGGDVLPRDLAEQLAQKSAPVINLYGPTEATIWSSLYRFTAGLTQVYIGCPIDNTQLHILDEDMVPIPGGELGELYIGGCGLSRGYLGQPGMTAERFVPNPFATAAGVRLYRTGDQVRRAPTGEIAFMGRVDNQVKLRGFRIELGDIEHALSQHPHISENVVVLQENRRGHQGLVAYLVFHEGVRGVRGSALRLFLACRLPEYMIPVGFKMLAALPLTLNGKVDRKLLATAKTPHLRGRGRSSNTDELKPKLNTAMYGKVAAGQGKAT